MARSGGEEVYNNDNSKSKNENNSDDDDIDYCDNGIVNKYEHLALS